MTSLYRRFLKLCEVWPVDVTKSGRDLGSTLRQKVAHAFRYGETSDIDQAKCEETYTILARISSNYYKQRYARVRDNSATGLTFDECQQVTSTEAMEILDKDKIQVVEKLREGEEDDKK